MPRRAYLLLLVCWLLFAPATAGAIDWKIGRTPDVFRTHPDSITTRVGGWMDASYEDNDSPGSARSINVNHLNIFLDTRYGEEWQVFVEAEFEHESDLIGFPLEREYELEQGYVRYRLGDALEVRLGQFNTPFGYWTPVHWTIVMETIRPPLHEQERITPEQQQGLGLIGRWFPRDPAPTDLEIRYAAYTSYGNSSSLLQESKTDGWSLGGDLRLGIREEHFAGVSYFQRQRELPKDRSERSIAFYGQTQLTSTLLLRAEYVRQQRDSNTVPELSRDINIAYAKLRWRFHSRFYLNYRFNWGDDDSTGIAFQRRVNTFTLGYQPKPWLRLKAEYSDHDFDDAPRRDFRYWGLSIGTLF
ncbi:MAG: DUF481 domain-containing protein [bacterium]|nr:DUF481 domain-containing protein [bacterium]